MTPNELREARAKLGLTQAGLARALRLGARSDKTVRRWESGESAVPGPAAVAIELLLHQAKDIAADALGRKEKQEDET